MQERKVGRKRVANRSLPNGGTFEQQVPPAGESALPRRSPARGCGRTRFTVREGLRPEARHHSKGCPESIFQRELKQPRQDALNLTYVNSAVKLTYMEKTQIYLRKEELDALRKAAARSGRSVAELVRDAVRKVVLKPRAAGPVAIWDGEPKRASIDHDSVHDQT